MREKARTIDGYIAALDGEKAAALEKLRRTIRAAAPGAEECIGYGLPAFRQDGPLVAFGATSSHCAFYPMSGAMVKSHEKELEGYDTSKGTIRFQADDPLPAPSSGGSSRSGSRRTRGAGGRKSQAGAVRGPGRGKRPCRTSPPATAPYRRT
jgi:uncharacterized protein YdhG (YjbR/CyaY superfamily)